MNERGLNPLPTILGAFFAGIYVGFKWGWAALHEELIDQGALVDERDFVEDQRESAAMGWQ